MPCLPELNSDNENLSPMKEFFGLYIHIPFCIQICPYCPFAKYKIGSTLPQKDYLTLLKKEMHHVAYHLNHKKPTSIYFGGGTPSTLKAKEIIDLILELERAGFDLNYLEEITVEVDPKTMLSEELSILKTGRVNRVSLGAQTCNNHFLSQIGRIHRSSDIQNIVEALHRYQLSFSMDLLFGLPCQTLKDLENDLQDFLRHSPYHISAYLLEVPAQNKFYSQLPSEEIQAQMLESVEKILTENKFERYELSNYARPGFQSRHNLLYWNDQPYLGLGLGAHSYLKPPDLPSKWASRFWNPRTMSQYKKWVESLKFQTHFYETKQETEKEELQIHQSLTDFCYTQLRKTKGLRYKDLLDKYNAKTGQIVLKKCQLLEKKGLVYFYNARSNFALSQKGRILSNLVFEELTFLKEDLRFI